MNNNYYLEEVKDRDHIEEYIKLLGFRLGDEIYAVDVMDIEEIIRVTEITSIPRADKSILGVINLRGRVVPVVDLRIRFNLDKYDFDKNTSIVVLNFNGEYIGFVVDSVTEVMNINKKNINPNPPLIGTVGQEYVLGIYRLDDTMVFILDINRIVFPGDKYEVSRLKKEIEGKDLEDKEKVEEKKPRETEEERESREETPKRKERKDLKEEQKDRAKQGEKERGKEDRKLKEKEPTEEKDIDKLIEEELKKREKETEELIKRKKEEQNKTDSKKKIDNDNTEVKENEVAQENIDQMIAAELGEKREEENKEAKDIKEDASDKVETSDKSEDKPNIKELRKIAKNIIDNDKVKGGEESDEKIEQYVKELEQAKDKYENHINALINVKNMLPKIERQLRDVDRVTSKSTDKLFNVLDSFGHFYEELLLELDNFNIYIEEDNLKDLDGKLEQYEEGIEEYKEVSLQIYEALEFEDISDQTIKRILKLVSDVKANLSSILGYIKKKEDNDNLLNQGQIDKILNDFGLE
ncbi:MAG: chemotaxis protein CheW [Deferribacterota bacterium]|nr:chemotaxis protein CheW [Deferribacterota bacterium]